MSDINSVLLIASFIILFSIAIYTLMHRKVPGAYPLFIQMVAAIIWTASSYFEIKSSGLDAKLLWRNFQQVGVFVIPITNVFFAVDYSKRIKVKKNLWFLSAVPIISLMLIFTDRFHHLMRSEYKIISRGISGQSLVIQSTMLGQVLVLFNSLIPLAAVIILFEFRKQVTKHFKSQVFLISVSIFLTPLLAWIRGIYIDGSGVYIPVAVVNIPSAVILLHCLLRYSIFSLSPIARDKVFDVIKDGILVVDQLGNIVDRNSYTADLMSKYLNLDKDIIGMSISKVFKDIPEVEKLMRSQEPASAEAEVLTEYGSVFFLCSTYPLGDGNDRVIGQVLIMRDITEKKLYELSLLERAEKDGLTKLLNRQGFNEAFDKIINTQIEASKPVACLMIDIDYFKKINDSFGHAVGDKVLQNLAKTLKDALRDKDIIGRIGGEEFAVILPGIDKSSAFAIAERIRKRVEESGLNITEGRLVEYTVSIGIADNGNFNIGLKKLLHMADMALYEAKEKSRNCTVIYNEP